MKGTFLSSLFHFVTFRILVLYANKDFMGIDCLLGIWADEFLALLIFWDLFVVLIVLKHVFAFFCDLWNISRLVIIVHDWSGSRSGVSLELWSSRETDRVYAQCDTRLHLWAPPPPPLLFLCLSYFIISRLGSGCERRKITGPARIRKEMLEAEDYISFLTLTMVEVLKMCRSRGFIDHMKPRWVGVFRKSKLLSRVVKEDPAPPLDNFGIS